MEVKGTSSRSGKLEWKSLSSDAQCWVSNSISQEPQFSLLETGDRGLHDDGDIFYRIAIRTKRYNTHKPWCMAGIQQIIDVIYYHCHHHHQQIGPTAVEHQAMCLHQGTGERPHMQSVNAFAFSGASPGLLIKDKKTHRTETWHMEPSGNLLVMGNRAGAATGERNCLAPTSLLSPSVPLRGTFGRMEENLGSHMPHSHQGITYELSCSFQN